MTVKRPVTQVRTDRAVWSPIRTRWRQAPRRFRLTCALTCSSLSHVLRACPWPGHRIRIGLVLLTASLLGWLASGCGTVPGKTSTACYARSSGPAGKIGFYIVYVPGVTLSDGSCSALKAATSVARCFVDARTSVFEPIAPDAIQNCLRTTHPGAAVGGGFISAPGGRTFTPAPRGVGALYFGLNPFGTRGNRCGAWVDPRLAASFSGLFKGLFKESKSVDAVDTGLDAIEKAEQGAVIYGAAVSLAERRQVLDKLAGSSDEETVLFSDDAEFKKARTDIQTASEVAQEQAGTNDKLAEKSWLQKVVDWFSELFEKKETELTTTNGQGGPIAPAGKPVGEGDPCSDIGSFVTRCAREGWRTSPCRLMLLKLRNPSCNPTVALTDGNEPCASGSITSEEAAEAVRRAKIKCWSVVHPIGPDAIVCGLRTARPSGTVIFSRGACGDPKALVEEGSCVELKTPEESFPMLARPKVGPRPGPNPINIILGMRGGQPLPNGSLPRA
jgi:hypothetical protein